MPFPCPVRSGANLAGVSIERHGRELEDSQTCSTEKKHADDSAAVPLTAIKAPQRQERKCQGTAAWTGMLPLLPSGPGGIHKLDIRGP